MTLNQLQDSMQVEVKPVFFDLQTSWCGWCRKMEATTFKDSTVSAILNNDFYPIKFDAERKDSVFFAGVWFQYEPNGPKSGTHKLAKVLGENEGRMKYPTVSVVDTKGKIALKYVGYATAGQLVPYLRKVLELEAKEN